MTLLLIVTAVFASLRQAYVANDLARDRAQAACLKVNVLRAATLADTIAILPLVDEVAVSSSNEAIRVQAARSAALLSVQARNPDLLPVDCEALP